METTLQVLNGMERAGLIGRYAIGGAVGAIFLDIFVELPTAGSGLLSLSQVYDYLRAARLLRRRSAVERSLSGGCA